MFWFDVSLCVYMIQMFLLVGGGAFIFHQICPYERFNENEIPACKSIKDTIDVVSYLILTMN